MKTGKTLSITFALIALGLIAVYRGPMVNGRADGPHVREGSTGLLTIIAGQGARLNLVRVDEGQGDGSVRPCRVELQFFDGNGQQIGQTQSAQLKPGESASIVADGSVRVNQAAVAADGSVRVRGVVRALAGDGSVRPSACGLVATFEGFDQQTGSTLFLHPSSLRGFNPQPDPPRER